ncbi:hypothetical protein OG474_00855 [Kribbella sp. NBC_01505]|uniref:hypothetical protein n=1 Tax=Kribbella sp. NBC_01505 TaxID=2903580 RepID=UPI00386FE897
MSKTMGCGVAEYLRTLDTEIEFGSRAIAGHLQNGSSAATAVSITGSRGLMTSGTTPTPSQLVPVTLSTTWA